jgi:hypothetical protein
MSASTGVKIVAALAFVVIGLPAGLCTLSAVPTMIAGFFMEKDKTVALQMAAVLFIPTLIFGAIFYFLLRWVIRVFSA